MREPLRRRPGAVVSVRGLLLLAALSSGCALSLDHQAELLLHPSPAVQVPALAGAAAGALLGAPAWGPVALAAGPRSPAAAYALHVFAYPGALLLAGIPWWIAGPSWERAAPGSPGVVPEEGLEPSRGVIPSGF